MPSARTDRLLCQFEESEFRDLPLLNRIESMISTREELERCAEILVAKSKTRTCRRARTCSTAPSAFSSCSSRSNTCNWSRTIAARRRTGSTREPTEYGTVYWNRGDTGDITVRLMGYLWLNNVAGLCARMNIKYYTESGAYLTEKAGGSRCAADNDLHAISIDLQPYTSTQVGKVTVQLQTQGSNGSWNVVGSETADIGIAYEITGGGGF